MLIEVKKLMEFPDRTLSQMTIDGKHFCFVLEDGHRDIKVAGETRIDAGLYDVVQRTVGGFYEDYRAKFGHKFSIQIKDVPNFEQILIHIGNFPKDTRGCLLIGYDIATATPGRAVQLQRSTDCYKVFYILVEAAFRRKEAVQIKITR
jgi:hypothetical protein